MTPWTWASLWICYFSVAMVRSITKDDLRKGVFVLVVSGKYKSIVVGGPATGVGKWETTPQLTKMKQREWTAGVARLGTLKSPHPMRASSCEAAPPSQTGSSTGDQEFNTWADGRHSSSKPPHPNKHLCMYIMKNMCVLYEIFTCRESNIWKISEQASYCWT